MNAKTQHAAFSGQPMSLREDREKWNRRYAEAPPARPEPHAMVGRWADWVPQGPLLDAACGLGRGIASAPPAITQMVAVDCAEAAVRQARALWAGQRNIHWIVADLATLPFPRGYFAMVCSFGFTDWTFLARLPDLLMRGGVVFHEGFSPRQLEVRPGLNPAWTADPDSLRNLLAGWRILELAETEEPPFRTRVAAVRPAEG